MTLRAPAALALTGAMLAGCPTSNNPVDTGDFTDRPTNPTDNPITDTSAPDPLPVGGSCTLSPALADKIQQVRVGPGGVVWLSVSSELYRYEATDDGTACTLEGEKVWEDTGLEAVTDFELDAAGNAYLLIFFDEIAKIDASGKLQFVCGDDDGVSGHAVAVTDSGDRVYTVPVGTDELRWHDMAADDCVASKTVLKLANKISTAPAMDGAELVVDYHDAKAKLPPGVVLDPTTGTELRQIGDGKFNNQRQMAAIADIAPTAKGYWIAGSPDGDLWFLDKSGAISSLYDAEDLLATPDGDTININSVGYSATGPDYVAASFIDLFGLWRFDF